MRGRHSDVVAEPLAYCVLREPLRPVGLAVSPHDLKRIFPRRQRGTLADDREVAQASGPRRRALPAARCRRLWDFTVIRKRAALPAWKDAFQVMRRNCETDWAQRFPQYAVSEWLGHDITVSATHYLAVPEELYQKASAPATEAVSVQDAPKSAKILELSLERQRPSF